MQMHNVTVKVSESLILTVVQQMGMAKQRNEHLQRIPAAVSLQLSCPVGLDKFA